MAGSHHPADRERIDGTHTRRQPCSLAEQHRLRAVSTRAPLGLAGGVAGLVGLSLLDDAGAKKKKKGGNKKKCTKKQKKAGKCGGNNGGGNGPAPYNGPVFTVSGRTILDTGGDPVQLRGVNKMSVFDDNDPRGDTYFAEIAKSKSNTVRIVWAIEDDNGPTNVNDLAALIANCQANKMLPMIELHDATGDLSKLPRLANYWTRNDVLEVIFKAGGNLLINIGNEVGDDTVTANQWVSAYTPVIRQMRNAGIRTPLVIDAPDFGKNLNVVVAGANDLLNVDPNLIFSVHPTGRRTMAGTRPSSNSSSRRPSTPALPWSSASSRSGAPSTGTTASAWATASVTTTPS
jgi:hypothetical protein